MTGEQLFAGLLVSVVAIILTALIYKDREG